jgi:hypothetical protein
MAQWQADVAITGGATEYKYVVKLPGGGTLWEEGGNRRVQVNDIQTVPKAITPNLTSYITPN